MVLFFSMQNKNVIVNQNSVWKCQCCNLKLLSCLPIITNFTESQFTRVDKRGGNIWQRLTRVEGVYDKNLTSIPLAFLGLWRLNSRYCPTHVINSAQSLFHCHSSYLGFVFCYSLAIVFYSDIFHTYPSHGLNGNKVNWQY